MSSKRVHFIAIGGSAMHNLAIALHRQGFDVSGSDDEIFEPSRSRLDRLGLLPDKLGWRPEDITKDLDAVILGMHARIDNPELKCAQELGIPVYSYPSYFYERTRTKTRVVIGGSHGKTTITSMIVHVLRHAGVEFDYLVGAQLDGFDCMVKVSDTSKVAIIEGDEYLASALQPIPKFHLYKPDIALISGIAWDHINVFKTFESYVDQFRKFIALIEPGGKLVFCGEDQEVKKLAEERAVTLRQAQGDNSRSIFAAHAPKQTERDHHLGRSARHERWGPRQVAGQGGRLGGLRFRCRTGRCGRPARI